METELGKSTGVEVTETGSVLGNDSGKDFDRKEFCLSGEFEGYAGASLEFVFEWVTEVGTEVSEENVAFQVLEMGSGYLPHF